MNNNSLFSKIFHKKGDKNIEISLIQKIKENENKITDYDKKMILNIIELSDISVKEIMVPRVDVVALNINSDIDEIIKIVDSKGRSRLPVYNDNIDNIVGILHAKDLLKYNTNKTNFNLSKIVREPYFIPESKIINDLLIEFREKRIHLAVVVDEYGGMSGIVCLEDIIEKIVGDIQDEFDNEMAEIRQINENTYLVDARISLEELNERLGLEINNDDIDTLGGLIYVIFGKIPVKNDIIEYNGIVFTIESITGRKIKKIKMEILDKENNNQNT